MTPELEKQIHEAAPNLYHTEPHPFDKENLSVNQLARLSSPVYLDCGDGWFHLLLGLSQALEAMGEDITVHQVKEKFGGLRFYIDNASDAVHELIDQAEEISYQTCERCGQPGRPRKGGWVSTLCDIHARSN